MTGQGRLLVVDDQPGVRYATARALRQAGFEVEEAETGGQALAAVRLQPELVLLDVSLPDLDGFEVCRRIKADPATTRVSVLYLSAAHTDGDAKVLGLDSGADGYLTHPIEPRVLVATVNALLRAQRAERARLQSEARFRAAFDASPAAIVITALSDGRVRDANAEALRLYGAQRDDVVGKMTSSLGVWLDQAEREGLILALRAGELIRYRPISMRDRTGSIRMMRASFELVDFDGEACVLALMQDVSEVASLESQLRQSQKMEAIGRLAGGIAHDFNNILNVILGRTELAQRELPPGSKLSRHLEDVRRAGERAVALTRQLLAFSRKQSLALRVTDLNQVAEGIAGMLRPLIGEHVALRTVLAPGLPAVLADTAQFEQVLMNLAVNARDAMPNGGQLTIETSAAELDEAYARGHAGAHPGQYVRLAVGDDGCGMTEDVRAHAFEPFFTTKGPGEGTGLGLSMVYGIVKQSGGYVWLSSEPGRGSSVEIFLPRIDAVAGTTAETKATGVAAAAEAPLGRESILLVEDDEALRDLTREVLEGAGYRVRAAASPAAALRLLRDGGGGDLSLLLTDMVMPGMGGGELARRVAEIRPGLKALFMSGYTGDTMVQQEGLPPELRLLSKPFLPATLLLRVREAILAPA